MPDALQLERRLSLLDADARHAALLELLREELINRIRLQEIEDEMMDAVMTATYEAMKSLSATIPYHTSALTGHAWLHELFRGHPERIRNELGVHRHVFFRLIVELSSYGLDDSLHVTLVEQLAIFLYGCTTGLSIQNIGERFQHSNDTILESFIKILVAFSSDPFYATNVSLAKAADGIPRCIRKDPKFYPWFKDALGALGGAHLNCAPVSEDRESSRNYNGGTAQNVLAACTFDMKFTYMYNEWEGSAVSAADSALMFNEARVADLHIPEGPGKYYLSDAGFPPSKALLVPYKGVRYHLREWGQADVRPASAQELFNLRHTSACNVIGRIFGVLKHRFKILRIPPELDTQLQARLPYALAAVHNFIRKEDPRDVEQFEPAAALPQGVEAGQSGVALTCPMVEREEAHVLRDSIADAMWEDYQLVL